MFEKNALVQVVKDKREQIKMLYSANAKWQKENEKLRAEIERLHGVADEMERQMEVWRAKA